MMAHSALSLAVSPGKGFAPIFMDLGVTSHILYGIDLPSTGDIFNQIDNIPENNIIILPNNNNIIPAALLAKEKSPKNIAIIPTKNVIEGITSTYGFSENENIQNNVQNMKDNISMAKSLFVYKSISQTVFDSVSINKNDYFVLQDKVIAAVLNAIQKNQLALIISYLSGSVNYAIIITKLVKGVDIRTIGNNNPGTSNVVRNVGKLWGVLVGFLDGMKGFIPILLARLYLFQGDGNLDYAILYLMGLAAVTGHCKPIFYNFDGGGGIGTMQGVSLSF